MFVANSIIGQLYIICIIYASNKTKKININIYVFFGRITQLFFRLGITFSSKNWRWQNSDSCSYLKTVYKPLKKIPYFMQIRLYYASRVTLCLDYILLNWFYLTTMLLIFL